jgi:glycosyltransferase involved in cell wall biosynthesis
MDLIAIPYHDWRKGQRESVRTRDGHLMREFGASERVRNLLVIDRPVSLAERIGSRRRVPVRGERIASIRLDRGWVATITKPSLRTSVLDLSTAHTIAPLRDARGWWFDVFQDWRTHAAIDWAVERLDLSHPSMIAWTPAAAGALEHLASGGWVFDSLDNWITHPVLRRHADRANDAYGRILGPARAVLVPSEATRTELNPFRRDITVVPNGVDLDRFAHLKERPRDLPAPPIVGYVGKLGIRLDVDYILAVAEALPETTFVFIGPELERAIVRPLHNARNIVLLGDRRVETVPEYLAAFDVAWIPHRVGEGETGGDLMKKYEYWAARRQVVTTPIADLGRWLDQLHVAADPGPAASTIRGLLSGQVRPKPTVVPFDRTWPSIAGRILDILAASGTGIT